MSEDAKLKAWIKKFMETSFPLTIGLIRAAHKPGLTTAGPSESSGLMVAPRANSSSTPTRFTAGPDGRPNDSSKDKGGLDCLDDDCNKCNHYHFFLCPGK